MKITDVRRAVVNADYGWTFIRTYTDEDVTGLAGRFSAPVLPQGGICHGC
jgi:hypothetical protein